MSLRTERVSPVREHYGDIEARGATSGDDLLPSPSNTNRAPADVLVALQSLILRMRDNNVGTAKARIDRNDTLVKQAMEAAQAAREREAKARSEDGGFFDGLGTAIEALTVDLAKLENISDPVGALERSLEKSGDATINSRQFWTDLEKGALEVAKWAAVAASVALAVVSCGAAAPLAALAVVGAVMSCAAAADSTFHILEKCGVDKETAMWIDIGLCVGGAVCSGGSGVAQAIQGGTTATNAAVRSAAIGVDIVAGAGTAAGGVAHTQVARFERDAKLAEADTMEAQQQQERIERRIQKLIETIRETLESSDRGVEKVTAMMNQHNATMVAMVRA